MLFASGSGSNAERIIEYFKDSREISVNAVFTNNPKAGVIERAERLQVPIEVFEKSALTESDFTDLLVKYETDLIILAGFLLKIPEHLIRSFPDKIINIHPALLPKFGGKGMYGQHVHQAVLDSQDVESGITIHLVNENYDEGRTLFQAKCPVNESDTSDSLAGKIHALEYAHFPRIIQEYALS